MQDTRKRIYRDLAMKAAVASTMLAAASGSVLAQAQKRDLSKGNTLYVVPYSHLDTQWRWAYPQVIRDFIPDTMHSNFKLIDKYPNYVFNFSGSRRYEMMREYYPADYAKVKGYVKAGRWFPAGSSVDEADANVPSGESLLRHVLYGNRFFRNEFGVTSQEFMLPDCFGFPYALPSILVHCGLKGFSTQKLTWGSANGIPFKIGRWEGPDGKSIVSALDPGAYVGDVKEDLSENTSWLARIQNTGKISGAYVDYHYYGTGDMGGAPNESSVAWVERSLAGKGPIKVVSSKADEMFQMFTPQQIAKLPHYKGELLLTEHSAGSITSQAYMKRWNRQSELLADTAERASVAAMWLGGAAYPSDRLYQGWDLVLGSQMHDMLPGTSLPKAYEYCWNDYVLAMNMFAGITKDAVGVVTSQMDTRAQGKALVVFNPLSIAREDVVEATIPGAGPVVQVYGPDGRPVPTQVTHTDAAGAHVLFLAKVPANGFASFDARTSRTAQPWRALRAEGRTLENGRFKVTVNEAGDIASIFDKANNREVLKAPARLALQYHNPGAFPAWNMDWADAQKPPYGYVGGPAQIRVIERGPVRVTLEVVRETAGSKFVQHISLSAGSAGDRVEVRNKIDWQTRETALKASFPLTTGNPKATYDLQVGAIERGNNDPKKYEVPQHQWLDLTKADASYGVAILNDSKFGSDKPDDDTVRLTLLYTPGVRGGYQDQATQDIGRHDIAYAIAPHKGDWRASDTPWQAKRLNQPLRAFSVPAHAGKLGKSFSLLSTNSTQVEIMAVKKAEDTGEVIVRLRELDGRPARGIQVKAASPITGAREVTGQEYTLAPAKVANGVLTTDVGAYGLRSFALKLGTPVTKAVAAKSQSVALPYDLDVASNDGKRTDGAFDGAGRSYPAEQLPSTLTMNGVSFKLGSTKDGSKNALAAKGQTVKLPSGFNRVYVLAASAQGDRRATFQFGNRTATAMVPDWGGYVGQWDNRLWIGQVPELTFNWNNPWGGLVPGYVKDCEVAWYASHRHHPTAGNEFYQYSYLFAQSFDVPAGATSIKLPNDPAIRVFAISVARDTNDGVVPAKPLFDTLKDRTQDGKPGISVGSAQLNDVTQVTLTPPLYWRSGGLRYTLDGSTPTRNSAVYQGPISLYRPTTVKVAELGIDGTMSQVASMQVNVNDVTAPKLVTAASPKVLGLATVTFSEPVDKASAEQAGNYRLSSGGRVESARLLSDGKSVELVFEKPLAAGGSETLIVNGVKDRAPGGNVVSGASMALAERTAVFTSPALEPGVSKSFQVSNLPTRARDAWTINMFVKANEQPADRTIIGGFGRATDGRTGAGRYITKFARGIHFWSANRDVETGVPLDLGKWQMITATYDGTTLRVFKNGAQIAEKEVELANDQGQAHAFPPDAWERQRVFKGEIRDFTIWNIDLSPTAVQRLWQTGQGG